MNNNLIKKINKLENIKKEIIAMIEKQQIELLEKSLKNKRKP